MTKPTTITCDSSNVGLTENKNDKMKNSDYLLLKWGTLKGWNFENSPKSMKAMKKYLKIGASYSVMLQVDTQEQKKLICEMIDGVNGTITLDWTGEDCTNDKEKAKKYVTEYGK